MAKILDETTIQILPFDIGSSSISNTIGENKGDLIGFTRAGAPERIPVGADGQVLTADSSYSTGVRWKDISGTGGSSTGVSSYMISIIFGGA